MAVSQLLGPGQHFEDAVLDVDMLRHPAYLGSLAVAAMLAHVVLTRQKLRDWWHVRLEKARLKRAA